MFTSKYIQVLVLFMFPACLMGMQNDSAQEKNWIEEALACPHAGAWTTQDRDGKTVIVEGEIISKTGKIISSEADVKKLASLFADMMQWTFDLSKESLLWRSFIKTKNILCGNNVKERLYAAYIEKMSDALGANNGDLWYIFTVSDLQSDGTKTLLGAALFDIKKDYTYGMVELDLISLTSEGQGRSLSTILAGAIFNFLPQIKRMILDVRATNKKAIDTYVSFGFTKYAKYNRLVSLVDPEYNYEYLTELPTCQKLQARAAMFQDLAI